MQVDEAFGGERMGAHQFGNASFGGLSRHHDQFALLNWWIDAEHTQRFGQRMSRQTEVADALGLQPARRRRVQATAFRRMTMALIMAQRRKRRLYAISGHSAAAMAR